MIVIKVKNFKTNSCFQRQLYAKCQSFIQLIGAKAYVKPTLEMRKVINNNSWTLYKNVPWSKVSSFKLRVKLKTDEFFFYGYVRSSSSVSFYYSSST